MSLIGKRSAVVSLGVSCQPARQIRLNQELLCEWLGDELRPKNLPLDWLFAPPGAVAQLLVSPTRVPPSRGELLGAEQPFWPRHGAWLWHDPNTSDDDFAAMQVRQNRRWERFDGLAELERRVFVVANTQNNLDNVAYAAPLRMDFCLTADRMNAIASGVTEVFGREGNSLFFVAYANRLSPDARQAGLPLIVLEPDESDHEGDNLQWRAAFEKFIASTRD